MLQYVADGIRKVLVKGIAARYGGDQIAVISEADTMSDINAMEHCFGGLFQTAPVPNLSYKIGVYALVDRSMSVMQICDRAMEAVKAIKHNYDTVIAFYDGPMNHQQQCEHRMQSEFEDALKNHEFKLWFQPKYDAVTEKIVGAEALVRWIKDSGELIPPGMFIPLFERDRRIGRLDAYVFRKVCELQARRAKDGKPLIPISVNMSRNTVYREKTAGRYEEIIRQTGISSSLVPIELTESAAFLSTQIRNLTNVLKEKGFRLIMDDFGSGYSSLTSLCILPFDEVKLDKSLIDFIGNEKNDIILEAIITAAKKMGMRVVAEGVEQKSQLDFLRKNDCDVIQGYYFAKPVPEEVFEQMLEQEFETQTR